MVMISLKSEKFLIPSPHCNFPIVHWDVSRKHVFDEKNWLNPLCKYLEAALKESKRIFDFDKFLGVHKSFLF
jgi:hypothetical protein